MRSLSLLMLCVVLVSCAKGAGIITGAIAGGPNVAANVQAGSANTQTVGQTTLQDQRIDDTQARNIEQSSGDTQLRIERVETVILREDPPAWLLLVALIGWLLPTPQQIGAAFVSLIARPFRGSLPGG